MRTLTLSFQACTLEGSGFALPVEGLPRKMEESEYEPSRVQRVPSWRYGGDSYNDPFIAPRFLTRLKAKDEAAGPSLVSVPCGPSCLLIERALFLKDAGRLRDPQSLSICASNKNSEAASARGYAAEARRFSSKVTVQASQRCA